MGFCLFDNVAIAARWAQAELGLERVAIVDWDVHHGNGTQAIFWDDRQCSSCRIHQWPFYPGSGGPDEQSETTVNIPLGCRSGDDAVPRTRSTGSSSRRSQRFEPELLLVSAGFDAHAGRSARVPARDAVGRLPRDSRRAARSSRRASPRCSRAATTSRTLPDLVDGVLLEGFG